MTVRPALGVLVRRWYVVLAVLLVFGWLYGQLKDQGAVYATHTTVTFTLPSYASLSAYSGTTNDSVITFAGAVVSQINAGHSPRIYSEADAPVYGAGIRQGELVALHDAGNQWNSYFPSASIDVQVVGPSVEWVHARQQAALSRIKQVSQAQQAAQDTKVNERMTATVDPLSTEIYRIGPSRSEGLVALAAMGLAATICAGGAAALVEAAVRHGSAKRTRGRRRSEDRKVELA